ncbi:MAG: hypothetical protein J5877_02465 [Clostridia bacterium]|nr:hypothetical protein [Oscillospiraceae bacterium]MBO4338769.1 hypothetical protein [Clostridia bacterium]
MNKEEILAKNREDNKNQDEMEKNAFSNAGRTACAVGGILCMVILLLEVILTDNGPSLSLWAIYLSMTGTMLLVKYKSLRKTHELIFGLIQLALAVVFLVLHIMRIVR